MTMKYHEYIGDGVYAMFDGYQIWLAVDAHDNPPVVALEPKVLDALNAYSRRIWREIDSEHTLQVNAVLDNKGKLTP